MTRTSPAGVPLPRGVHHKNGALYLVRRNRWTWLCLDGSARELHDALGAVQPERPPETVAELLAAYLRSGTDMLRPVTRAEYERIANGRLAYAFGHMRIGAVTQSHVAQFLQDRQDEGAGPMGNRERAVLSSAYEFGLRRGFAQSNPCRGIRRNKERASRVEVSHEQLAALIDAAPAYWQPFFQAVYLTGWRVGDLVALERTNLHRDGIRIVESKNNVEHFKEWSPTLRAVVQAAIEHGDDMAAKYGRPAPRRVFTGRYGQPLTYWAVSSQMARMGRPFELRQVRAKAETDRPGTLGHRGQMARRYTRSVRTKPVK